MKFENIFFDLDGTLTDPKVGITRCIQYALQKLGRPIPCTDDLLWCIGPPLIESLKKLLGEDSSRAESALAFYRERFDAIGKFENEIYPEIPGTLAKLNNQGITLYVATSKPEIYANDIIAHFNMGTFFKKIYGSRLNGDLADKGSLLSHIFQNEMISSDTALMVGDRCYDMLAAAKNGIRCLGVTYGYGTEKELLNSGARYTARSPHEVLQRITDWD